MSIKPKPAPPMPQRYKRPQSPKQERIACFRKAGYSLDRYRYPERSELVIEIEGKRVPIIFSYIGYNSHSALEHRCRKLKQEYPTASIYITIQSRANTEDSEQAA